MPRLLRLLCSLVSTLQGQPLRLRDAAAFFSRFPHWSKSLTASVTEVHLLGVSEADVSPATAAGEVGYQLSPFVRWSPRSFCNCCICSCSSRGCPTGSIHSTSSDKLISYRRSPSCGASLSDRLASPESAHAVVLALDCFCQVPMSLLPVSGRQLLPSIALKS